MDRYFEDRLLEEDPVLSEVVAASERAGLPAIQLSASQAKQLELLVRIAGATQVLEVGTLGGYSAIHLARGVGAKGRVVTLEIDPAHAEVARRNIELAGVADRVEVIEGSALEILDSMIMDGDGPFDFIFIDADKESNVGYVERAVALGRPGSVILVDNVVRDGGVADESSERPDIVGTRAMMDLLHDHPRLEATAIQTVGVKGYDGFALLVLS